MSLEKLRKVLKTEKLHYGSRSAIKKLKLGAVKHIFLAYDCDPTVREDIIYYCKLGNVELIELHQPSTELSLICKRAHPVSVISY